MSDIKLIEENVRLADKAKEKAQKELNAARDELEADTYERLRPIATLAHELICQFNHTDGCGWLYEKDNWNASDHKRWLYDCKSSLTSSKLTIEELSSFLSLAKQAKELFPVWQRRFFSVRLPK